MSKYSDWRGLVAAEPFGDWLHRPYSSRLQTTSPHIVDGGACPLSDQPSRIFILAMVTPRRMTLNRP